MIVAEAASEAFPRSRPVRGPKPYSRSWVAFLVAADVLMFTLSSAAALWVAFNYWNVFTFERAGVTAAVVCANWVFLFSQFGLYHKSTALSIRDEFYYTVTALCLGVAPLLVAFTLVPVISSSRVVIVLSLVFAIAMAGSTRAIAHKLRDFFVRRNPRRVAIVGTPDDIRATEEALNLPEGSEVFSYELPKLQEALTSAELSAQFGLNAVPWFGELRSRRCQTLMFTEMPPPSVLPYLLEAAARDNIKIAIAPPRMKAQSYSLTIETDGQQALIVPSQLRACRNSARLLKRITDLFIAGVALLIFAPVMAAVALVVYADSGNPVLFRQTRVGRNGKEFEILKFRTMTVDAESKTGPTWVSAGDARRTRIGSFLRRTSLDELPQLFNVIQGDMSVVGPRPERPVFAQRFREHLPRYDERHLVRPGITGLSHVSMSRTIVPAQIGERLSYDLYYLENWSLLMDFSILFKTAAEIAFHRAS